MKKYICSEGYMREIYARYISPENKYRPEKPLSYQQYIDKNFLDDGEEDLEYENKAK